MKHLCKFSANAYTLVALMLLIQVYPTSNLYSQVKIADDEASSYSGSWPMEMIKDKVSMHGQIPMDQIQVLLLEILVLTEWELLA